MGSHEHVPKGLSNISHNEFLALGDEMDDKGKRDKGKRETQKKAI